MHSSQQIQTIYIETISNSALINLFYSISIIFHEEFQEDNWIWGYCEVTGKVELVKKLFQCMQQADVGCAMRWNVSVNSSTWLCPTLIPSRTTCPCLSSRAPGQPLIRPPTPPYPPPLHPSSADTVTRLQDSLQSGMLRALACHTTQSTDQPSEISPPWSPHL